MRFSSWVCYKYERQFLCKRRKGPSYTHRSSADLTSARASSPIAEGVGQRQAHRFTAPHIDFFMEGKK
jgi:hypothetical protein